MNTNSINHYRELFSSFIRDNGMIIILFFLYVFFYHYWEQVIAKHVVDSFLCHFESSWFNDIIFFIALLICIVLFVSNWRKLYKQRIVIISIFTLLFWIYYRFFSRSFSFISLHSFQSIMYIDILPIYAVWFLLSSLFGKLIPRSDYSMFFGYIRDAPILPDDDYDCDCLERTKLAETAVMRLLGTDTSNGSFAYGIAAPWGAGKTTFMNLMKRIIRSDYPISIIIDFNPWLYSAEKDLVTAFIEELSKRLKYYDQSLVKNLIDYSKLLSAFGTEETNLAASLINLNKQDISLSQKKLQIIRSIKQIKKPIVVFIDDLDRLDAYELMEMMKLIRNISDIPYMHFVASYDRAYLVQCLGNMIKSKGISFVEKIFQYEFHLPPCPPEILRKLLYTYISETYNEDIDDIDLQYLKGFIIYNDDSKNPLNELSNIREVKHLANHFNTSFYHLEENLIDEIDLLLLELFKTKYPLVFSFFEQRKTEILLLVDNHNYYTLYQGDNDKNHINFLNYIELHQDEFDINDIDQRSITTILERLFNTIDHEDNEDGSYRNRFNQKEWFDRYFNLIELETDITYTEFEDTIKKDDFTVTKQRIDEWSMGKTHAMAQHMIHYQSDNIIEQKNLIKSMLYSISINNIFELKEIDKAITKLKKFNDNNKYTNEDIAFMKSVLKEYGCRHTISNYIAHLHQNINQVDIPLNDNELTEIQVELFKMFIEKSNNDTSEVLSYYDIYMLNSYDETPVIDPSDRYVKVLSKSMREYAEDHILDFIPNVISLIYHDRYFGDTYEVRGITKVIWETWDHFYEFINNLKNELDPIIPEFKEFILSYKRNDYKGVPFKFKSIDVEK